MAGGALNALKNAKAGMSGAKGQGRAASGSAKPPTGKAGVSQVEGKRKTAVADDGRGKKAKVVGPPLALIDISGDAGVDGVTKVSGSSEAWPKGGVWESSFDVNDPMLDNIFIPAETVESMPVSDMHAFLQDSLRRRMQEVSFVKYLQKHLLPTTARASAGYNEALEANKQMEAKLREAEARVEGQEKAMAELEKEKAELVKLKEAAGLELEGLKKALGERDNKISELTTQVRVLESEKEGFDRAEEEWEQEKGKMLDHWEATATEAFDLAVEQIRVRNPGVDLETRGISVLYEVEGGRIWGEDDLGKKKEVLIGEALSKELRESATSPVRSS